jgi:hypothetical protein
MIGSLGFIVLGIAIWRSQVFPRWAGLLLAIGGPLYLIGPGFVPHEMFLLNLLVYGPFAAATVWLGVALLNTSESEQKSVLARAERAL